MHEALSNSDTVAAAPWLHDTIPFTAKKKKKNNPKKNNYQEVILMTLKMSLYDPSLSFSKLPNSLDNQM